MEINDLKKYGLVYYVKWFYDNIFYDKVFYFIKRIGNFNGMKIFEGVVFNIYFWKSMFGIDGICVIL